MGRGSSKAGGGNVKSAYNDILNGKASLSSLGNLKSQMQIDKAAFTTNGNSIKSQNATIQAGNQRIDLTFYTNYEPSQTGTIKKAITTNIEARVWENGNIKGIRKLKSTSSKSQKNAATQYTSMLSDWKKLTGQKRITF